MKWSGAMALFAAVIVALVWETSRRHREDRSWAGALGRAIARESFGIVIAFLFVPVAVYMITWIPLRWKRIVAVRFSHHLSQLQPK